MNDLKTRVRYPSTLDKNLLEQTKQLSKITRIPLSKLMDEAMELLLNQHKDTLKKSDN